MRVKLNRKATTLKAAGDELDPQYPKKRTKAKPAILDYQRNPVLFLFWSYGYHFRNGLNRSK